MYSTDLVALFVYLILLTQAALAIVFIVCSSYLANGVLGDAHFILSLKPSSYKYPRQLPPI